MDWLKQEMKARGITQRELGEAIGLDDGKMSRVLSGGRKLSANEADGIRRYLGFALPDDASSDIDRRLLRALSLMNDQQKKALEVILEGSITHNDASRG